MPAIPAPEHVLQVLAPGNPHDIRQLEKSLGSLPARAHPAIPSIPRR
jgi:hypothetical protein